MGQRGGVSNLRLVLASASTGRLGLLRAAGFEPEVRVSHVDEDIAGAGIDDAATLAVTLARAKARSVASGWPQSEPALVLGADSVLAIEGHVVSKPVDADQARRWWHHRRGRDGVLHSGLCVIDTATGAEVAEVASTIVTFGYPTDGEIDAYLATNEPLCVAGAFTIDGRGAPFVDRLDGDHSTVIGMSLPLLRRLVDDLGHRLIDAWEPL